MRFSDTDSLIPFCPTAGFELSEPLKVPIPSTEK